MFIRIINNGYMNIISATLLGKEYFSSIYNIIRFHQKGCIVYMGKHGNTNWGDSLNNVLLPLLSCKKPVIAELNNYSNINKILLYNWIERNNINIYCAVGSRLQEIKSKNVIVWGAGFLHEKNYTLVEPKRILAVRGPLSAEALSNQWGFSTKVYGDPAVLYSVYYKPNIEKRYALGIIPHYVDYERINKMYNNIPDVKVINIRSSTNSLINEILSCRTIASSSLHGLIISDAYNIPTTWIKWLSKSIDYFKYYDYYYSINCEKEPFNLSKETKVNDIISNSERPLHHINMKKLLSVCPFYNEAASPIKYPK